MAMAAASPSLPSMKLYRLSDHAAMAPAPSTSVTVPNDGPDAACGHATAMANHSAASAWTSRRTPTPSARTSSRRETSASNRKGISHCVNGMPAPGAVHRTTGSQPAQMAMPPPRGRGAACSERALGTSCGNPARTRNSRAIVNPLATNAAAMAAAIPVQPGGRLSGRLI